MAPSPTPLQLCHCYRERSAQDTSRACLEPRRLAAIRFSLTTFKGPNRPKAPRSLPPSMLISKRPENPTGPQHPSKLSGALQAPGLRPTRCKRRLRPPHLLLGFPVTALLLRHAASVRAPAPAPAAAPAPLNARTSPQAAEPAQAPAEPQQTEQGRVLPGLGSSRPRRAAAAPQGYPHSFGSAASAAAAPAPAGTPRPAREAAPCGARPGATAAARRRRHLGTVRGAGEAGGGAARAQGRGEGSRGGAKRGGCGSRQQLAPLWGGQEPGRGGRGLGWPRAGHHGSRSPGRSAVTLRPHLESEPRVAAREREAQRPLGNVVQTALLLPPTARARELGLRGQRWRAGEPVPGLEEVWSPVQTPPIVLVGTSGLHRLLFPGYRGRRTLGTRPTPANEVR